MSYQIRWKNFRGYEDTGWLDMKPLTVLLGANDSGKSSFLGPLLLMKQTIDSIDRKSPLVTRGEYFDAGGFNDFVFNGDEKREVTFGVRVDTHRGVPEEPIGAYPPGSFEVSFRRVNEELVLSRLEVLDVYGRTMLVRKRTRSGTYTIEKMSLPTDSKSKQVVDAIKNSRPRNFCFTSQEANTARYKDEITKKTRHRHRAAKLSARDESVNLYCSIVDFHQYLVSAHVSNLDFIGPNRASPRRVYELGGEQKRRVGTQGECAPEVLARNRELLAPLGEWLARFGVASDVSLKDLSNEVCSILVRRTRGGRWTNIADTGFGVSQIFPLIIQALQSNAATLVAEQPEVHLNPKAQSMLADLYCYAATTRSRTVVIETHSEHFVLRLRTLIAKRQISEKDVAIFFVERAAEGSSIRSIPVSELGHIEGQDWPKDFFGDSLLNAIDLAQAQAAATKSHVGKAATTRKEPVQNTPARRKSARKRQA